MKKQLEGLVRQMIDRGLFFDEATKEFEKTFISAIIWWSNNHFALNVNNC